MTFQIIQGDLFDPAHNFEALAQGVNTRGIMGAGIAVKFREDYPEMYEDYKALCLKHGDALGGLVHIWVPEMTVSDPYMSEDGCPVIEFDSGTTIYNMFSQIDPGANANYSLLYKAAIAVHQHAEENLFDRVGLPWIGAGIGGLERHNVKHVFEYVFADSKVEFVLVERD